MSFKKAIETAKKMQQNFEVEIPDGSGGSFIATCKILTGEEAIWTYRLERRNETEVSFEIIQNFRVFCASILCFKSKNEDGTEEILQIGDILKLLYLPEELADINKLPIDLDNYGLNELIYEQYIQNLLNVKDIEEYKKLTVKNKHFAWELLYKGMYFTFDQDYVYTLTTTFLSVYRKIRPNPVEEQLMASIMQIVNEAKMRANDEKSETEELPAEKNSTGSEEKNS